MIKNLYCFRHGQTDYNAKGQYQGSQIDAPLNSNGLKQAEDIPDIDLDIIYSSPLKRAKQTAKVFKKSKGKSVKIKTKKELIEIDFGDFSGKTKEEIQIICDKQILDLNFPIPNGEKKLDAALRFISALKEIAEQEKVNNIGIFTHGGVINLAHQLLINEHKKAKNGEAIHMIYDTDTKELNIIRKELENQKQRSA